MKLKNYTAFCIDEPFGPDIKFTVWAKNKKHAKTLVKNRLVGRYYYYLDIMFNPIKTIIAILKKKVPNRPSCKLIH